MRDGDVAEDLGAILASDRDPPVRRALAQALSEQDPTPRTDRAWKTLAATISTASAVCSPERRRTELLVS